MAETRKRAATKRTGDREVTRITKNSEPLSIEQIMEADDITEEDVPVPQWGGFVRIRSISEREMKRIRTEAKSANEEGELSEDALHRALITHSMIAPAVTDEDYERLLEKSSAAFMTILKAIMKNSGLTNLALKEEEKKFRS